MSENPPLLSSVRGRPAVVLTREALEKAVFERLRRGRSFVGRDSYWGASEVSRCARRVVWEKVTSPAEEDKFSVDAAWKVNLGRVLENEGIQLLRYAGVGLRETGGNQAEVSHPDLPFFRCHPDGRVLAPFEHKGMEDGDGCLEVKSSAPYIVKKWIKDGLPEDYCGQANDQMGLRGLRWCLFIAISREKISGAEVLPFMHFWVLDFDPEAFAKSEAKVQRLESSRVAIIAAAQNLKEGETLDLEALLPEGECNQYCTSCPLAPNCKAYLNSAPDLAAGEELPDDARLELDCILEELGELEAAWKPAEKRIKELKDRGGKLVPKNLPRTFVLASGTAQVTHKKASDFNQARLLEAVCQRLDSLGQEVVEDVKALFAAEADAKKTQETLTLKPRKGGE